MNEIFKYFIARGDNDIDRKRLGYASWFTDLVPLSYFDEDEKLFWLFIDYCAKLDAPVRSSYFNTWLNTELRCVLHETNCRVKGCEALRYEDPVGFETAIQTTTQVMQDNFTVLESLPADIDDFKIEMSSYLSERKRDNLVTALSQTYELLNETDDPEKASDFILDEANSINEIFDPTQVDDLDANKYESNDNTKGMDLVSDSGLPAIDKDSTGLYTSQLFGIQAQPGDGKTRMVIGTYAYRALTVYKKNVAFYALEQREAEIRAMFLAHHVFRLFGIQISDRMIWTNTVPEELKPQVEAAEIDLFDSGKYGKLFIKETDLYVETFITKMRTHDKLYGPFDLIVIDYMGLIESKPQEFKRELTEVEIIRSAYKQFKRYLRRNCKAGIAVAQLNRDGVQAGEKDKEITTDMAQGGMAVYRNSDYDIVLTCTPTMRVQQKRRLSQPKVRASAGFGAFVCDVRLAFCYFNQIVQKAV